MKLTQLHDELRYHTQAMLNAAPRGNLDGYDEAFAEVTRVGNALRQEMEWRREMRPLMECASLHHEEAVNPDD